MKCKVVAITGKIGSGKSAAMEVIRDMGFVTVSCDELAKQVAKDEEVIKAVQKLLGSNCIKGGQLNRQAIREIVFYDEELLHQYQELFFEGVKQLLEAQLAEMKDEQAVFVEIPVLDAFKFNWDEVWCVRSSEKLCVERVAQRDHASAEDVTAIFQVQKEYRATRIIDNNGDVDDLAVAVTQALADMGLIQQFN